jgi:colanic acid/amylovoran biosynthesis glycosyltransferase
MRGHLAAESCQLLHIYFGNNGLFWLPLLRNCQVPVVVSFHGADVQVNVDSPAARRLLRELFGSATLVLARSESLAGALAELGCPPDKLQIQRAGIPLDTFPCFTRERPQDGAWRLLQACRLIEKKGLGLTLQAFSAFARSHPKAHLTIAGEGPLRSSLEKMVVDLQLTGKVQFTGFVQQTALLALYQNSHLFLHPSEQTPDGNREGVPNSMLEAMATGLPCIATRHGGIPEAITHLESGILVGESDLAGIKNWLESLVEDDQLRESLGQRAAQTIREQFDLRTQVEKLEDIYLKIHQDKSSGERHASPKGSRS